MTQTDRFQDFLFVDEGIEHFGIEGFAHGFADEGDEEEREKERANRRQRQPVGINIAHALPHQFAPPRRRRGEAEAEEIERGQGGYRTT